MKNLKEYIRESFDTDNGDIRLIVVDIPELTQLILKLSKFNKNNIEQNDGWVAFGKNPEECPVYCGDDYTVPSKYKNTVDEDDFADFMYKYAPYEEERDNIIPEDVIDTWDSSDNNFKDCVKDWLTNNIKCD